MQAINATMQQICDKPKLPTIKLYSFVNNKFEFLLCVVSDAIMTNEDSCERCVGARCQVETAYVSFMTETVS